MILHIQMIFSLHLGHFKTWFHIKEVWLFKQRIWHPLDPKDGLPLHRLLFLIINKRRYNYIKPKSTSPSNNLILPISFTQLKPICRASKVFSIEHTCKERRSAIIPVSFRPLKCLPIILRLDFELWAFERVFS